MKTKTLDELVIVEDPAIPLIRQWAAAAENHIEILPPADIREEVLLEVQVTTHSTLGAMAYDTGGILVDHGWLRFLGSGHLKFKRTLSSWNRGRSDGMYLVADDAVGGFFAINGGAFGGGTGNVYHWSSDALEWEPLRMGLTDFFRWSLTSRLADFYQDLRWPRWKDDLKSLSPDQCFNFYPFLWTKEGSIDGSDRRPIPAAEAFDLKMDIVRQLSQP
jgi:hypothetical protein